jgi:hypothetical protein
MDALREQRSVPTPEERRLAAEEKANPSVQKGPPILSAPIHDDLPEGLPVPPDDPEVRKPSSSDPSI